MNQAAASCQQNTMSQRVGSTYESGCSQLSTKHNVTARRVNVRIRLQPAVNKTQCHTASGQRTNQAAASCQQNTMSHRVGSTYESGCSQLSTKHNVTPRRVNVRIRLQPAVNKTQCHTASGQRTNQAAASCQQNTMSHRVGSTYESGCSQLSTKHNVTARRVNVRIRLLPAVNKTQCHTASGQRTNQAAASCQQNTMSHRVGSTYESGCSQLSTKHNVTPRRVNVRIRLQPAVDKTTSIRLPLGALQS